MKLDLIPDQLTLLLTSEGFTTQLYEDGQWRTGTRAVSLPLDTLKPASVLDHGYAGEGDGYSWQSTFTAVGGGVQIHTRLYAERAMPFTPSMILWLDALDDLDDRQAHTWRQTVLRAPTLNASGLGGNDLPACYIYDHATHTETICYFPPEKFAWDSRRFCDFTMREVLRYHPDPRYGLGLHLNAPTTHIELAAGDHEFVWWFTQHPRREVPTPWEAQRALIESVAPLLNPLPRPPTNLVTWSEMAQGTQRDLAQDDCWITVNGVTGLRAYVLGSSAVGRDKARGFELMTQLDVLHPLLMWAHLTGNEAPKPLVDKLLATLAEFDRADYSFVANNFPPRDGDSFMDTWYFLENALIKLPWVAFLTHSASLRSLFFQALKGAKTLAHHTNYLFPLFADAADWQARGSLLNVGVGGLYAAGCVLGWQLSNDRSWIDEAAQALCTLHSMPPHMLTHEPQQLSFGAAAAQYLARIPAEINNHREWSEIAADLVRLSLRMGYWGADAGAPLYDPRGMFQACASLCYPAFKENVETLLPWSELLKSDANNAFDPALTQLMAAFANLGRAHNYAFFDPYLPPEVRQGPCPNIPYEDLATSEFTHTATLGKELYGAGEVFWNALLFDALGQTNSPDNDILCLSLDVPILDLSALPLQSADGIKPAYSALHFLLYNAADDTRHTTITTLFGVREVALEPRSVVRLTVTNS